MNLLEAFNTGNPEQDQAARHGLLQMGLALLQGKGNFGPILGQAGMHGLSGMQQFQGNQFAQKQRAAQLEDIKRKRVLEGRQDTLDNLPGQFIKPEQMGVDATGGMETASTAPNNYVAPQMDLAGLAQKYMGTPGGFQQGMALNQAIQKQTPQPIKLGANERLLDPKTLQVTVDAQADPAKQSPLAQLLAERNALPPGSPMRAAYDDAIKKASTHQPATRVEVNNNTKQEGAEAVKVGNYFGDLYSNAQTAGVAAGSKLNRLARMEQLLSGYNTGKFTPLGKDLASAAQSLGWKVDPNLGNKEAADALSNELALEARSPAGGAGMPGAMSDKDREFLQNIVPGLAKSPHGNKQLIETQRRLAKRDQEVAAIAREYRKKNGTMNEGFFEALKEHADKHPLFGDMQKGPAQGAQRRYNPATGAIE